VTTACDTDHTVRTARTAELVDQLHAIVAELEAMHPGRRFLSMGIWLLDR